MRVRAVVEADPGAVIRLLQHFQARNLVPSRVTARSLGEYIEVEIDIAGIGLEVLKRIVAKIASAPITIAAVVCE